MSIEKLEDVRDTAVKLGMIYSQSPTDYAYLKGWIHCLLQKEEKYTVKKKEYYDRPYAELYRQIIRLGLEKMQENQSKNAMG